MGGKTRKPIALCIKSKLCNICSAWKSNNSNAEDTVPPPHQCTMNHVGTSGSMEPAACLEMTIRLHELKLCSIQRICLDDDASTRSQLKWTNADWMKFHNTTDHPLVPITKGPNIDKLKARLDKGKLPSHIPEPLFVVCCRPESSKEGAHWRPLQYTEASSRKASHPQQERCRSSRKELWLLLTQRLIS
jgi:hypothetical protein